jgi:hypothetical protein
MSGFLANSAVTTGAKSVVEMSKNKGSSSISMPAASKAAR